MIPKSDSDTVLQPFQPRFLPLLKFELISGSEANYKNRAEDGNCLCELALYSPFSAINRPAPIPETFAEHWLLQMQSRS